MDTIRAVSRNTAILFIGKIAGDAVAVITTIFFARYIHPNDFGTYSFVFAYLGFFGIVADLGISDITLREISRDAAKTEVFIGNAILMKVVLSFAAIGLACGIIFFLRYPFGIKLLVFAASLTLLFAFRSVYILIFQLKLKMEYHVGINFFTNILKLILFLLLIRMGASLVWFIIAFVAAIIPEIFLVRYFAGKFIRPRFTVDPGVWKYLLRESWPLTLTAVFIIIYTRIDHLMLFQMKGPAELGNYAAAVRLTEVFNFMPSIFMVSAFPLLSRYFISSREKLESTYNLSFKYLSMVIIPIATGISILAEPIVRLIYGSQFLDSIPALRILIWAEVFTFLGIIHLHILIAVGLQRLDFLLTSSGAILNVILNLFLIPRYGITGAALATLVSYGMGVPISCALNRTRKYGMALVKSMFKPLGAAGVMALFTYGALALGLPLAVIIVSSAIIYFIFIILIRGLDMTDMKYFRKAVA